MKRLILTRHTKSSWDDPQMPDHDRPLNERGKAAAADLGQWLASRAFVKPALYHAGPDVMLAVLRHAKAETVMMIGHNPGIAEFAARLVAHPPANPEFARYPTGATLVAEFDVADWAKVEFGTGVVVDFVIPREVVV
ncbi:MAG: phosphoglycerate mutase [Rhodobacterales bacterium 32-66-7]|nr:MAG: phosphoglycerate mutase [Rhodobacterales bacterium 32-66-7]